MPLKDWTQMCPIEAKAWKTAQSEGLLPSLFKRTPTTPQIPPGMPPINTPDSQLSQMLMKQLIKMWDQDKNTISKMPALIDEAGNVVEAVTTTAKMSDIEAKLLKRMCGYNPDSDNTVLPMWIHQLFQKNQTDNDKDLIVAGVLAQKGRFDEERIPIYHELKKMVAQRKWTGGEAGGNPKLAYACYGLTPFAMLDLTEDEISQMDFDHDLQSAATGITLTELKSTTKKLTATVPEDGRTWRSMILKFTNLVYNLFEGTSPIFERFVLLAKALRDYPPEIIENLPPGSQSSHSLDLPSSSTAFCTRQNV